jgi:RNA polymerase sigma-70 factor (ECF subfamily)
MGSERPYEGIDEYAAALIRCKARQLIRRPEFKGTDPEDLEQEMILDLLQRLPQYDPIRAGRNTFIARVVEHKVATLLEFHHARRRDTGGPVQALREDVTDVKGAPGGKVHSLDECAHLRRIGAPSRLAGDRLEERLDVQAILDGLPEDLRQLAHLLRSMTLTEISNETGIPRTSLYRALARLKKRFQESGVERIL